jgi:two-component system, NarL family, nitrate/nitrite response regulator NarL
MRLVLCDDNRLLVEALAAALKAWGHETVAITTSALAGVAAVTEHMPDACLLDLRFPNGEHGLSAARQMRARCPGTAVVVLTAAHDKDVAWEAREIGVAGLLSKDQNVTQIARALDVIASGGVVYEPAPSRRPLATPPRRQYELTPREMEVVARIVAGQSTEQMSVQMNIATSTVRTYVKNLLTKLGAHSRLEAAALASREGLVSTSDSPSWRTRATASRGSA